MAAKTGLSANPAGLARQLEALADHGLLGRLPTTTTEPVFDTVAEPHCHLVYEDTAQTVDLQVSPETLLSILRQALAQGPGEIDILIRFRAKPAPPAHERERQAQAKPAPFVPDPPPG